MLSLMTAAHRMRNRLTHDRANKLVRLFHNLRLTKRMTKTCYTEPAIGWFEDESQMSSGVTKFGLEY